MRGSINTFLAFAITGMTGGAIARGQVFTPAPAGNAATPGTQPAANAPATAPATSAGEQLSRRYLEAKQQRDAAAGRYAEGDPKLLAANQTLRDLREQMAAQHGAGLAVPQEAPDDMPTMPVYPRIVPVEEMVAPAALSVALADTGPRHDDEGAAQAAAAAWTDTAGDTPEDQKARATLKSSRVSVHAEQDGLEQVLNGLRDQSHTNFFVNWPALQAAGVDKHTLVSVQFSDMPLAAALTVILRQIGSGTANLNYTVDSGFITISTNDDLASSKYQVVDMYNVTDFGGAATLAQYPAALQEEIYENRMNNLVDMIKATVSPDTWRDAGGTIGSIREFEGILVINQTADNQRAVARLLAQLRAVRGN